MANHNTEPEAKREKEEELEARFLSIVAQNDLLLDALGRAAQLNLQNWYIGAGCVVQMVWNHLHHFPLNAFISDVDIVYFDDRDLSFTAEDNVIQQANELFADFPLPIDVKNQARVHLWYEKHFGYPIPPHQSVEGAIALWPAIVTSLALRPVADGYKIYAPYGLTDLFSLIVRPNKQQISQAVYEAKCQKWGQKWPKLTFIAW